MKSILKQSIIGGGLVLGAGLWLGSAKSLESKGMFDYTPNVATLKGSPYGKILAFAMQGPIDFYWHEGQTHADAHIYNAETDGGHECAAGCDAHGHNHGQDHESNNNHQAHASDISKHAEGCDCGAHGEVELVSGAELPWHVRSKEKVGELAAFAHRKTNGEGLTKAHALYLQEATEDKLKFAYELDPSNYTNYGNYQIFLSSSNLGRSNINLERHLALSRDTLEFCKKDAYDPSSWITASMASYDMAYHMAENLDKYSLSDVRASLSEFDSCMQRYSELLVSSYESGRSLSVAKTAEVIERARFLTRLREAFDVYVERLSSEKG